MAAITNGGMADLSDDEQDEREFHAEEHQVHMEFQDEQHRRHLLTSLNTMRKNRTFCDVILQASGIEYYCHRAVMASASSHLMELFTAEDEEKQQCNGRGQQQQREAIVLKLTGAAFEAGCLDKLIDYCYTSKLHLTGHEVRWVYLMACYFKIDGVKSECAKYLIKNLNVENCVEIRSLPDISKQTWFVSQLDVFISEQFEKVRETTMFLALPCAQIEILCQAKSEMNNINVSAHSLTQRVIDWIRRSYKHSQLQHLSEKTYMLYLAPDNTLQDCTQLPYGDASDTQLVREYKKLSGKPPPLGNANQKRSSVDGQTVKPIELLSKTSAVKNKEPPTAYKLVETDWSVIGANKVSENTVLSLVAVGEKLTRLSIMLRLNSEMDGEEDHSTSGGSGGGGGVFSVAATSPQLSSLASSVESLPDCTLANMSFGKASMGCAALNGAIIVCGGYDRVECIKNVEMYNAKRNCWDPLPAMLEARGRFGIAVVDDCVYAVGGSDGTTELSSVERYDSNNRKWSHVASLPLPRSNAGVCELSKKVYCIGGWNGQLGIKRCDIYDPETNAWSSIAPLQTGRYQAGVCSFNGLIYAVGGCDGWNCLTSVECYNPQTDSWMYVKPLITARRGCGLAVFNGKLYTVGGSNGNHSLDSVEVFDCERQEWTFGPSMKNARANVGLAVLEDKLYAIGGFSGKNFLNSVEFLHSQTNKWTNLSQTSVATAPASTAITHSNSNS